MFCFGLRERLVQPENANSFSACLKLFTKIHTTPYILLHTIAPFLFITRASINITKQSKTTAFVATGLMLFALFFDSGNLIYPPTMGQKAGSEILPAIDRLFDYRRRLAAVGRAGDCLFQLTRHSRPRQPRGQSLWHHLFRGVI